MNDLITQLEAATEGSRELDEAIAFALGWKAEDDPTLYCHPSPADPTPRYWFDPAGYGAGWGGPPRFTESLDAALPGEKIVMMSIQRARPGLPPRWCALNEGAKEAAMANTEVLARRIAALKARAAT